MCGERRRLSGKGEGCRTAPHWAARPARGKLFPAPSLRWVGPAAPWPLPALCRCCPRARTRHFKPRRRARGPAQHRAGRAGGSCPWENTARIPRRRPSHPARGLPGVGKGQAGSGPPSGRGGQGGSGGLGTAQGVPRELRRRLPRAGPRRLPPPRSGGGARREGRSGAGRGGGQRGDSGRAPIRGGPSRGLPGAVCQRPPGLRREPIRGRLPARGAEGTQERRGRRSLPP